MNREQFLTDLQIEGCITQVSNLTEIFGAINAGNHSEYREGYENEDMYFLGGVTPGQESGPRTTTAADIRMKNYIPFDFDIRKNWKRFEGADITDEEIMDFLPFFRNALSQHPYLRNWRYIIFSGNGIHVYLFGEIPLEVREYEHWRFGCLRLQHELWDILDPPGERTSEMWKPDPQSAKIAQIMRLPESRNNKGGQPRWTKFLDFQDARVDLREICQWGKKYISDECEKAKNRAAAFKIQAGEDTSVYEAIQKIPVHTIVCRQFGWESDGKNFWSPESPHKHKACFVPLDSNFVVHAGTDHFPSTHDGYSPFEFVKYCSEGPRENRDVFEFFKQNYPHIAVLSEEQFKKMREEGLKQTLVVSSIRDALDELEALKFETLKTEEVFDTRRLFLRGCVTRIGAFSNVGKSTIAYYLVYRMLEHGYSCVFFSTEVKRPVVLANFERIRTGREVVEILEKKNLQHTEILEKYKNLSIYDGEHMQNSLELCEQYIAKHRPDFVVIDYVQAMRSKQGSTDLYERMTQYALEIQAIAQKYGVCVLDLSQVNNAFLDKTKGQRESDFVGLKGSGDLFSAADIVIELSRDQSSEYSQLMQFIVRKHKYCWKDSIWLDVDFKKGTIRSAQAPPEARNLTGQQRAEEIFSPQHD